VRALVRTRITQQQLLRIRGLSTVTSLNFAIFRASEA